MARSSIEVGSAVVSKHYQRKGQVGVVLRWRIEMALPPVIEVAVLWPKAKMPTWHEVGYDIQEVNV